MATNRMQNGLKSLLEGERVRRVDVGGQARYVAVDVVAALADTRDPAQYWADLKLREPALAALAEPGEFRVEGGAEATDAVRLDGVLRLVQSVPSARAEHLKAWLARTARERLEEAENPELALLRARRLYEQKGYSRPWVDKRLRGVSARHELTGEWYRRGATESEQFRQLTNRMVESAFGMDVERYRRHKNLFRAGENLRDHMTDLELALVALAETVAVNLHRDRRSQGCAGLLTDAADAGAIVAQTREAIEDRSGRAVVTPGNHRGGRTPRRRSRSAEPRAA